MTVLVTGGTGFIGGHLVDALVERGEDVHILDRHDAQDGRYINPHATLHVADVADADVQAIVRNVSPTTIYHLAAQISVPWSTEHPIEDATSNVIGSLNLLEAARSLTRLPRIVFMSTGGAIYGELAPGISKASEDLRCEPISPYGASKLAVEGYLRAYQSMCGLLYTIIRPGNVYGPRQTSRGGAGVVAIFSEAMIANRPVTIYGDGSAVRDYIFVRDMVDGILVAADADESGPFNIASGRATSVNDVFAALSSAFGYDLAPTYVAERATDVAGIVLDVSRAAETLGWQPATSFEAGIAITAEWYAREASRR